MIRGIIHNLGPLGFALFLVVMITMPAFAADPDSQRQMADRLITEALKPSDIETNLRRLTDEIGGRIPGTPAFQQAVNWGVEALKTAGADNVHTEEFSVQHSWTEGATSITASLYSGTTFPIWSLSVGVGPPTAAHQTVPARRRRRG